MGMKGTQHLAVLSPSAAPNRGGTCKELSGCVLYTGSLAEEEGPSANLALLAAQRGVQGLAGCEAPSNSRQEGQVSCPCYISFFIG